MNGRGSLYVAIFFLLLGLSAIIQSLTFRYWESIALPMTVSGVILVVAVAEVVKELRHREKLKEFIDRKPAGQIESKLEIRRFGLIFSWTAMFLLATYLFGFYIAIPLFTFSYLKWRGRKWITAGIFAVVILGFIYGIFEIGLNTPLFPGIVLNRW